MKAKQIRQITDGSIVVAIYGLIFLLSRFMGGQLEYSVGFLMPLPLAIYAFKYDLKTSVIPFVAALVVSLLLSVNPLNVLVFNLPYLFIGSLLGGILIKKEIKPIYSILIIALITAVTEVLGTIVLSKLLGIENILVDIQNIVFKIEEVFGVNSGAFGIIQALLEGMIPSIIVIISLMNSLVTYLIFILLASRIFKCKFNNKVIEIFSLNNMIPRWMSIIYILVVILSTVSLFLFDKSEGVLRVIFIVLINMSLIVGAIYLYFGIRVSSLYIRYLNKKWLVLIEFLLVLLVSPFFVILGLLDNFFSLQTKIFNKISNHS